MNRRTLKRISENGIRSPEELEVWVKEIREALIKLVAIQQAANSLMAYLGAEGTIDTDHPAVDRMMHALHDFDGGVSG